ncbi:MAG: SpoIIE family protein phosphatase [Actinomycetota bacterium]
MEASTAILAVAAAELGTWGWDLESGHISWDERLEAIYGLASGTFDGTYETYKRLIHPEDRGTLERAVREALDTRSGHHVEHRVVHPDGTVRWVEGWGRVLQDGDATVTGMVGVARDVTVLHGTKEELEQVREGMAAETERLERLQSLTAALSRAVSQEDVANVLVAQAIRATDATAASVSIVTEGGETLDILASSGYEFMSDEGWGHWPMSMDHPLGEAARTGEPRWMEQRAELPKEHPGISSIPGIDRFGAFAALPLLSAGCVIGAIGLSFQEDRKISDAEREHLLTMTGQVAVALERARLYEEADRARLAARRANERLTFLSNATQLLASSLEYDETVSTLARLCVPDFADWAGVDLVEPGGQVRQLIVVHEDPEWLEYARGIRDRHPLDPDEPRGLANVLRTSVSEFYPEIPNELLEQAPEEQREIARNLQLSSIMIVPLEVRGTVLGAMTLAYAESGRHYDEQDLRMVESLGRRAAIAIDNARIYLDRDHIARTLQRSLLPPALPMIPGAELAARYEPFGDGHEVGGDFYDVFNVSEDEWGMVIGDVCGKGAEAAAVMGIARFTTRAIAMSERRPSTLLTGLNEALMQQTTGERFCTACYCRVRRDDTGFRVTVSLAGHPRPLVLRADGSVQEVGGAGTFLGVFADVDLSDEAINLYPGDALILYTDGVIGRSDIAGGAQLLPVPARNAGSSAGSIADALIAGIVEREGERFLDDVAVLVLRVTDVVEGADLLEAPAT